MKQSTFSAVMANSIKNLLQGYTKGIRFVAVLTFLLTMGVGAAWGTNFTGAGIKYYVNTKSGDQWWTVSSTSLSLGTINSFYLKGFWAEIANGNVCQNTRMYYRVNGVTKDYNILDPSDWNATTKHFQTESMNENVLAGLVGGNYTLEIWFSNGEGECNVWYSNNSNNYKITFTYNPTYTVSVKASTGGTVASSSVTAGNITNVMLPQATPSAGYSFVNWTVTTGDLTLTNATSASAATVKARSAGTVTASFKANQYSVTLNANGGTGGTNSVTATYGQAMPSATMPTRTGYTFNGYFDATSAGTQYYKADGTSARTWNKTANTTLFAQWTLNTYPVKWYVNGEELTGAATTVAHGNKITTIPEVDLNTYCEGSDVLAGWTTAPMENASVAAPANLYKTIEDFPIVEGPQTYYAVFANYKE